MSVLAISERRRTISWVAWGLWALILGLLATSLSLAAVTSFVLVPGVGGAIGIATMATAATLVITRWPRSRSGWLLLAAALSIAVGFSLGELAVYTGIHRDGDLGTTQGLIASAHAAFWLFVSSLLLLFLTFPDGRLPSPRWRPVVAAIGLACVAGAIRHILRAAAIVDPRAYMTDARFAEQNGFEGAPPYQRLGVALGVIVVVLFILTAASLVVRLRRARGIERQQLKWVVYAGVVALLMFPVGVIGSASEPLATVLQLVGMLSLAVIGAGFGVALFRYRLWDIDLVARRSLVFALLWLAIAGVYAGISAGLGLAAGSRLPVAVAIAVTALATLVFQPARRWLERIADRWVFGRRNSPLEAMHGFGELAGSAAQPGDIATQLAATASAAVGLAWVEVDLHGSVSTRHGTANAEPATVFQVSRGDEHFGELVCRPHRGRRLTTDDEALLTALAAQAATAVSRAHLASRIVRAQEAERRRIERNIHDGAQQELVALVAQLGLARGLSNGDESSDNVLATAQQDVGRILANLRELAQGIHPSVLSDGGLAAAVEDRCSTMPIGVALSVPPGVASQRFADDVEGAAYFFVTEALTNVLKHSRSEAVEVALGLDRDELTVEVADSGIGFDPDAADGGGLTGLADRIHALGGEITVDSQPGAGTRLTATFPVAATNATGS
jgi:signal transduction histidine kinase